MDFLLDANMPRSALRVLAGSGHQAWHVRDIGLGDATDERIDRQSLAQGWILVTRDLDFCDIRNYPPRTHPKPPGAAEEIARLLQRFLMLPELVSQIPGHLVILDSSRVRFRPALNASLDE